MKSKGYTLIELLVIIAIIGILLSVIGAGLIGDLSVHWLERNTTAPADAGNGPQPIGGIHDTRGGPCE